MIDVTREEFFDTFANFRRMESEDIAAVSEQMNRIERRRAKHLVRVEGRLDQVEGRLSGVEGKLETKLDTSNSLLHNHIADPNAHGAISAKP